MAYRNRSEDMQRGFSGRPMIPAYEMEFSDYLIKRLLYEKVKPKSDFVKELCFD